MFTLFLLFSLLAGPNHIYVPPVGPEPVGHPPLHHPVRMPVRF